MDEESPNVEQVEEVESVSAEQVQQIVTDQATALNDADETRYEGIVSEVRSVGDSVRSLEDNENEQQPEEITYTVRLDASQVETAKVYARVACTEGLIVVVLLALQAGLLAWQIVSDRWRG